MRILYVAGREYSYSRTHNVYNALKKQGFDVIGIFPPNRSFRHYPGLLFRTFLQGYKCDYIIVGFYGQLILPFIKLLIWKPIIFDMYIATFDTMVYDRRKASPDSIKARIYKLSDRLSCALSKYIVLETNDHIKDFTKKFGISVTKFKRIFLAVDNSLIYPRVQRKKNDRFLVHFHGEYAPFHGVEYIIRAAELLKDQPVDFQIIGKGITYNKDRQLAKNLGINNIRFYDPVPYQELARFMANADVCLGIFGDNERMLRVTTNKVIESIAMKKPLITGLNQPVQELLKHKQSAYLVERANPQALANAILELKNNDKLRQEIAKNGYIVFQENCTLETLGKGFAELLKSKSGN